MGDDRKAYQLQPACIRFVPQVLSEVQAVQILVYETKRMCLGRVHTNERYYIHTPVVKEAGYVNLVVEPLQGSCQ